MWTHPSDFLIYILTVLLKGFLIDFTALFQSTFNKYVKKCLEKTDIIKKLKAGWLLISVYTMSTKSSTNVVINNLKRWEVSCVMSAYRGRQLCFPRCSFAERLFLLSSFITARLILSSPEDFLQQICFAFKTQF